MKKLVRISVLVVALISLQLTDALAQKIGYVNSQLIISQLPEVKQMNANLAALGEQLQKKGEGMVQAYKNKEQSAIAQKEKGALSPVQEEALLKELQGEQETILKFEQEMKQTMIAKEQALTEPILTKLNNAIQEVAKENGYTLVVDRAVLLYAEESDDLNAQVRAKLNL